MTSIITSKPNTIPAEEVRFVSSESPVHQARVFRWRGEIYRAIRPSMEPAFSRLRRQGLLERLMERELLIPTEQTTLTLDGYSSVLKHKTVPFVTYPFEWSASALRDAAMLQIELNLELATEHMMCVDAHPWNVLFDGPKPVYVDLGSFSPITAVSAERSLSEFYGYYVYPLRLMQTGQWRLARALLRDRLQPMSRDEFSLIGGLKRAVGASFPRSYAAFRSARRLAAAGRCRIARWRPTPSERSPDATRAAWVRRLEALRREVAGIDITPPSSVWAQYYGGNPPNFANPAEWSAKQRAVDRILATLGPSTVADIGSNAGWYAQLAATRGSRTVAFEIDEACLEMLYSQSRQRGLYILPAYMNIRDPSPRYGWAATPYPEASERLKADCVFAFALIHHLVFHQMADFRQIVQQLSGFTRQSLVLEFVSSSDSYVKEWWHEGYSWYTLENLQRQLSRFFREVEVVPSSPEGRWLLVCRGKREA